MNYNKQRARGLKRKLEIIKLRGGKCEICGYDDNVAALEFHHENPEDKEMKLDMRTFAATKTEKLYEEIKKCILVCSNCHKKIHYPQYNKDKVENTLNGFIEESLKEKTVKKKTPTKYVCAYCGKPFKATTNKKFCSAKCRRESKHYPSYEQLKKKYEELNSWNKVCEFYSLGRNIIRRIRRNNGEQC